MDHQDLRELTGAYALGLLCEDERGALEAHLPTCPECAREVRDATYATRALAYGVEHISPLDSLRARVLERARRDADARAARPTETSRQSMLLPYGAIAASLAAIGFAFYAMTLRSRVDALEDRLRAAESATAGIEQRLARVQTAYDAARGSAAVLAAPDVRRIELEGRPPVSGATGSAFWSPSRGLVFAATGLPSLPAGRVYQLWIVADTAPVSAGLMTPDPAGLATAVAAPPAGVSKVVAIAVTLEPAGGVPAPTSPPILVGTL